MSFVSELRRRNVFKVAVAYAIVAWLLIEVASTVLPTFNAPQWVLQTITFVIILGFPLALIFAWAFELTPEGIKVTTSAGPDQYHTHTTGQRLNYFIIGILVLVVAFLVMDNYVLKESPGVEREATETSMVTDTGSPEQAVEKKTETVVPSNSIAVLPFKNISPDKDQDYFADGLTEELLNKLAQVNDLQVTGRTSSFYFKGKDIDLREIGKELGVAYLLEGSVQKSGDQIRITAQLIKAENGYHLWSNTYNKEMTDIFAIQDEIAKAVTTALSITLGAGEFSLPGNTRNVEAYNAAMKSRYLATQFSPDSTRKAITYAEQAVTLDPNYARGWLALRRAYGLGSPVIPEEESKEYPRLSNEAYLKAAGLAPDMWEIQAIEISRLYGTGHFLESYQLLEKAREQQKLPEVEDLFDQAVIKSLSGQITDAISVLKRAKLVDPFDQDISFNLAIALFNSGRFEEATREAEKGIPTFPNFANFFTLTLARIAQKQGNWEEANEQYRKVSNQNSLKLIPYLQKGDNQGGIEEIHQIIASGNLSTFDELNLAEYAALFGDAQLSLDMLNLSWSKNATVGLTIWNPSFSVVRPHPGFKDLMKSIGFVDYWRATGDWGDYCRPQDGSDDFECI